MIQKLHNCIFFAYQTPDIEKMLIFGNRVWTTQRYFPKILEAYKNDIAKLYDAEFLELPAENGEVDINNWVSDITKGKISNIIGKCILGSLGTPVIQATGRMVFKDDLRLRSPGEVFCNILNIRTSSLVTAV